MSAIRIFRVKDDANWNLEKGKKRISGYFACKRRIYKTKYHKEGERGAFAETMKANQWYKTKPINKLHAPSSQKCSTSQLPKCITHQTNASPLSL